ncbi:hypothetical protein BC833DRAFT_578363 [Globomyces pollinis-pini]|nr:hypothetical protein BC833DRAFT_578363 [Globomyces pollinis-pini]
MSRSTDALMEMDNPGPFEATSQTVAQLGISIEPLSTVLSQADSLPSRISLGPPGQLTVRSQSFNASQVASKILENFYNYCCSFATALPTGANVLFNLNTPYMEQTYIPMKALQDWYKNTLQKVQSDPSLFKEMDM